MNQARATTSVFVLQDLSVAAGQLLPVLSVPLLLPKKVGESLCLVTWKTPSGQCLEGSINEKKHSNLLYFLVAGPRIELGTL